MDEKLSNQGIALGVGVFAVLGGILMWLHHLLSKVLGEDWALIILAIPGFFSFFVIGIVYVVFVGYMKKRYCGQRGHKFDRVNKEDGSSLLICKDCGHYIQEAAGEK